MAHVDHHTPRSTTNPNPTSPMFYRMRDVLRMTALSRSSLYRRIASGTFPSPVSLGGAAKGWRRRDLEEWERDPENFRLMSSCSVETTSQGAKVRRVRYG